MTTSSDKGAVCGMCGHTQEDHPYRHLFRPAPTKNEGRERIKANLRKYCDPTPNPEGWAKEKKIFKKAMWSVLTPKGKRDKTTVAQHTSVFEFYWSVVRDLLAQRDQATLEFIEKKRLPMPKAGIYREIELNREILAKLSYNHALDDLKAYLTKGQDESK